jgi:DNA-binding NtrC family response regulator
VLQRGRRPRLPPPVKTLIPYGHGETVLLIDDEKPLVVLGEEMLAALGYEPVGFESAHQAFAAFRANPQRFDLVLIDEVMPEMRGTQLAAVLHQTRPELPVLLMTGYSGLAWSYEFRAMGICDILKKPLRSRDIAESLARHLHPSV